MPSPTVLNLSTLQLPHPSDRVTLKMKVYARVGLDLLFIPILVFSVITSQANYLHLHPCFRVSFWEPELKWKDRKYLEQWYNLPQREEWLWVVISSLCQKFHHKNGSTHLFHASVLKSVHLWVRPETLFPRRDKDSAIDYFLPLLDHRKQERSFTLNRLYHPALHRTSGCLHKNSLYRHICSLPTVLSCLYHVGRLRAGAPKSFSATLPRLS